MLQRVDAYATVGLAEIHILDHAGHLLQEDQPAQVNQAVLPFLRAAA